MKKNLTDKQVQAYRLVSGEHEGRSTADAAKKMSITTQALNRLLKRAEKKCPELFPTLTPQEAEVKLLLAMGWANADIANKLQVNLSRVSQITGAIEEKQGTACGRPVKMLSYQPWMDGKIIRRF